MTRLCSVLPHPSALYNQDTFRLENTIPSRPTHCAKCTTFISLAPSCCSLSRLLFRVPSLLLKSLQRPF